MLKKSLFTALSLMLAAAAWAAPVSERQALQEAQQFLASRHHSAGGTMKMAAKSGQLQSQGGDACYYIFNVPNQGGFVVVSGDDRTNPILGYSDQGAFEPGKMPPTMMAWLQSYEAQLKALGQMTAQEAQRQLSAPRGKAPVATRNSISPLVSTLWDQATPYWNMCPQFMSEDGSSYELAYTGCVATAMAQVMNYHQWPKATTQPIPSYSFTYSDGFDFGTATTDELPVATLDWEHMRDTYTGAEDKVYTDAVARLMLYAGHAVKMQYGTSASGAYTDDIPGGFTNYFGYDRSTLRIAFRNDYSQDAWDDLIYSELAAGRPMVYNGTAGSGGGHSFVCDGYERGDYFHINWGWGGMGNGFFQLAVLNPNASGIGGAGTGEGYNMKQNAIVGIQPDYSQGGGTVLPPDSTQTGDTTVVDVQNILTATDISINYNATTATIDRDSKNDGFSLHKSRYINVTYSDHAGTGMRYREGIALYDTQGNQVELILTTNIYSAVTTSATGDRTQFGRDLDARNAKKWGKGLTGNYRIVPVSQVEGSSEWVPMLESDRYYIEAVLTNYTATLTCHPIESLTATNYAVHGGDKVGKPARIDVTLANASSDRFFGNLYLWVDGEALDPTYSPFTSTIQAEVPAGGEKVVSFNFTPTSAGTKAIGLSFDSDGERSIAGQGSMVVEEAVQSAMDLSVAIHAVGATEPAEGETFGKVYDSHVQWIAAITNNAEGEYNRYVLAPLFIVSKDEQGNVQGGQMVTYKQASLSLAPGETKELAFEFDNLAYGSCYSLNIYARNDVPDDSEESHLTNLVNRGESKYYDIERGVVTWDAQGVRRGVQAGENIVIPAEAAAVSLQGLQVTGLTINDNPNVLYFLDEEQSVPQVLAGHNVVKGSSAELVLIADGYPFFTPAAFTADSIAYTRSLTAMHNTTDARGWDTMVLPFAPQGVTAAGQVRVAEFVQEDAETSELQYSYVEQMHANRPYLVALAQDAAALEGQDVSFVAANARVISDATAITSGQSFMVRGTFVQAAPQQALLWSASQGAYVAADGEQATVPAFRTWAQNIGQAQAQRLKVTFGTTTPPSGLRGDVNGDGIVDASDVTTLVDIILGKVAPTPGADINGDGTHDANDVTGLVSIILG